MRERARLDDAFLEAPALEARRAGSRGRRNRRRAAWIDASTRDSAAVVEARGREQQALGVGERALRRREERRDRSRGLSDGTAGHGGTRYAASVEAASRDCEPRCACAGRALPQVRRRHARIGGELGARPCERELAGLEHVAVVGDLQRGARVLLDQQDRHAASRAAPTTMLKISRTISGARPSDGSSSISSFGLRHQRAAQREHLALAAGQRAGELRRAARAGAGSARRPRRASRCAAALAVRARARTRRARGCPRRSSPRTARASRARAPARARRAARPSSRAERLAAIADRRRRDGSSPMMRRQQRRLAGAVRADHGDDACPRSTASDTSCTASTLP